MQPTPTEPVTQSAQSPVSGEPIPRATELPPSEVSVAPRRRPSTTVMIIIVFLAILAVLAYRNRDYIRFELVPKIQRYIAMQYNGAAASQAPDSTSQAAPFTKRSVLNHIISYDSQGILISQPNGTGVRRLIESNDPTHFLTTTARGELIYYSVLSNSTQSVYEKSLTTGHITRLLSLRAGGRNNEEYSRNVAIDSNVTQIAISHDDGSLSLYDIAKKERRLLQKRIACEDSQKAASAAAATNGGCQSLYRPQWSPDGQIIALTKRVYDGVTTSLIYPFDPQSVPIDLPVGGPHVAWMNSSSALMVAGEYENLYYVGSFSAPTATNVLRATFGSSYPVLVGSFDIFENQSVALVYTPIQAGDSSKQLAIYDIRTQRLKPHVRASEGEDMEVIQWIDDSQIFYRTRAATKQHAYAIYDVKTNTSRTLPIVGNSPRFILAP